MYAAALAGEDATLTGGTSTLEFTFPPDEPTEAPQPPSPPTSSIPESTPEPSPEPSTKPLPSSTNEPDQSTSPTALPPGPTSESTGSPSSSSSPPSTSPTAPSSSASSPTDTSPTGTLSATNSNTSPTGIITSAPSNSDPVNTKTITTSNANGSSPDTSNSNQDQTTSNQPDVSLPQSQLPGSTSGQAPLMSTGSGTSANPTGGLPGDDDEIPTVTERTSGRSSRNLAMILGIVLGLMFLISILLYILCCRRRRKKRRGVLSTAWRKMPDSNSVMQQTGGGTWYNDWRMRDPSSGLVADVVEKRPLSLPRLPWTSSNGSKADAYEDARLATHMLTSDSSWDRYSATPSFESTSSDAYSAAPSLLPVSTGDSSALTTNTFTDSSEYESEAGTTGSLSFTSPSGRPGTAGSEMALPVTSTGHYAVDGEIGEDKAPLPPISALQGGELLFINMPWQRTRESALPSIMEVVHSFHEGR